MNISLKHKKGKKGEGLCSLIEEIRNEEIKMHYYISLYDSFFSSPLYFLNDE